MSKAIEALAARLTPGTQMECLENTNVAERKGAILTITEQGKRVLSGTVSETRGGVAHRAEFGLELRAGLHMVDADTFRQPIERYGHSVTWRILVT
jgi:hypothetical protein